METIKISELNKFKMASNPPECVVKSNFCVIHNGDVKQYVGIGWITLHKATKKDFETIPQVVE